MKNDNMSSPTGGNTESPKRVCCYMRVATSSQFTEKMDDGTKREFPGGWELADDSCMQYVRRHGPVTFELIEYSLVSHDGPLYAVYTDILHLPDYEKDELDNVLDGFGYEGVGDVHAKYPTRNDANQAITECLFEHYGSFSAQPLCVSMPEAFAQQRY